MQWGRLAGENLSQVLKRNVSAVACKTRTVPNVSPEAKYGSYLCVHKSHISLGV